MMRSRALLRVPCTLLLLFSVVVTSLVAFSSPASASIIGPPPGSWETPPSGAVLPEGLGVGSPGMTPTGAGIGGALVELPPGPGIAGVVQQSPNCTGIYCVVQAALQLVNGPCATNAIGCHIAGATMAVGTSGSVAGLLPTPPPVNHVPVGAMDSFDQTGQGYTVRLTGWASDQDTTGSIWVDFKADNGVIVSQTKTDAASRRYDTSFVMPATYAGLRLCAWARDAGVNGTTQVGCRNPTVKPFGSLDGVVQAGLNQFVVRGWAIEPGLNDASWIQVSVDGTVNPYPSTANQDRPDVGAAFPGAGNTHGFRRNVLIAPGTHNVCVTILRRGGASGSNTALNCQTVTNNDPVGALDQAKRIDPTTYELTGWAIDPNVGNAQLDIHVYADQGTDHERGVPFAGAAKENRPDLDAANKAMAVSSMNATYGGAHGFKVNFSGLAPGNHKLCAYAINVNAGTNALLHCVYVGDQAGSSPFGGLDPVAGVQWDGSASSYEVKGWATDPDVTGPVDVHLYWDPTDPSKARGFAFKNATTVDRPDVANAFPGWGAKRGYDVRIPAPTTGGSHQLCAYAINKWLTTGKNNLIGCRTVNHPGDNPFGGFDLAAKVAGQTGTVQLRGWAIDPNTTDPIDVHVYVDNSMKAVFSSVNAVRNDVGDAFLNYGAAHGYDTTLSGFSPGNHTICTYAINKLAGTGNTTIGCKTVTV